MYTSGPPRGGGRDREGARSSSGTSAGDHGARSSRNSSRSIRPGGLIGGSTDPNGNEVTGTSSARTTSRWRQSSGEPPRTRDLWRSSHTTKGWHSRRQARREDRTKGREPGPPGYECARACYPEARTAADDLAGEKPIRSRSGSGPSLSRIGPTGLWLPSMTCCR